MKTLLTTLILIGLFSSIFAAAMWNNPVPVRKGDVLEWNRSSATTADGCVIYVWTGTRDGDRDIYAQKVNASGNIIWQQPMLVDNKPSRQSDPVITKTTDNNFIVAWYDYIDFSNVEIRTQKITSSGQKLWLSGGVLVSSGTSYEHNLKIVPDSNGGAYLSWPESRNSVSDVYGQRLDSSGNALWAYNGIPLSGTNISYYEHAVYLTTDGSLVVAYKTSQFTPNVQSLKVNLIAPDGSYSWNQPLTIVSGSFNSICEFQLCDINDSSLIIIFNAYSANDFFLEVYVHRFNLNGSLEWTNPVKVVPDIQSMYWPKVMPKGLNAGNNCVIIAWEDHRLDYDTSDIYIQKLDAGGNLLWNPSGIPVCTEDYRQYDVALISDNNGGCIIAWTDERNGGFINSDIFAQHIDTNGNILWENQGRAIGNASQIQTTPAINKISPNFFISWLDFRNGAMSIYYQVLNNNGNQLLENNGKSIHKGLPADFDWAQYKVLPRSDDAVAIWADYRHSNLGAQIYFQFINPDGSVDFTPNGKPITLSPAEYSNEFDAIVT
ncbi:MAG: hypothetical protein FJ041_04880, partial [Candidatus Cloacimonetes bacterium]|nr:hypothetical protein [Candidatus Cloacimonadota bacterium]